MKYKYLKVTGCFTIFTIGLIFGLYYRGNNCKSYWDLKLKPLYGSNENSLPTYPEIGRFSPLIFIGGWPRSGTTLMRIILDVNQDVRCGQESRVIPLILELYNQIIKQKVILHRKAIDLSTLDAATTAYILEVIRRNGPPAQRLCNKDPMSFLFLSVLGSLFPGAKFVLMVRDGRAVTHSVVKRGIKISNINISDPWDVLKHWNMGVAIMHKECLSIGEERCIIIKYENLILHPQKWITFISGFLKIALDERMFAHSQNIKSSNVSLNKYERSTDQVIKPISKHALYDWVRDNVLPLDFLTRAHAISPMLRVLNYDVDKLPPDYGESDK